MRIIKSSKLFKKYANTLKIFRKQKDQIIILATAHKVGSTWIYNILRSYFNAELLEVPYDLRRNKKIGGIIDLQNESALPG